MSHSTTEPRVLDDMYEQPRKSLMVNLIMGLFVRLKQNRYSSPHSTRPDFDENDGEAELSEDELSEDDASLDPVLDPRTQYEFDTAYNSFFYWLTDHVTMDFLNHKEVLDIGCGWGGKMIYYAENTQLNTIHGFDIPPYKPEVSEAFARSRSLDNCVFTAAYAEDILYDDNRFDVAIIDDVLEHVQDPEKTVSEAYRVLKPSGTLIIKSPSFKMMDAHHLDNAITWPGIHYLLSMKTWAAGLNHLLLDERYRDTLNFSPFYRTVSTRYHKCVTANLNGLDYSDFVQIIGLHDFEVQTMKMWRRKITRRKGTRVKYHLYDLCYRIPLAKEFLSQFVLFIGKKPAERIPDSQPTAP